jgi:hypothetical protein
MNEPTINVNDEKVSLKDAEQILNDASVNKPTEDEVNAATKEFNKKAAAFNKKTFKIGNYKKADAIYDFVLDFLENHVYWTKNGWMGVLKMHEELTETRKNRKEKDAFSVGYQALEFLFYALTNPGGTGIESAKAIEKVADIYIETMELAGKKLEAARKELGDVQFLQEKVAAMQQGFYIEKEDGVEAEEEPTFAAPTVDDLIKK